MNFKTALLGLLVYSLLGLGVAIYLVYVQGTVVQHLMSPESFVEGLSETLRAIGIVALAVAVHEYIAFDIRSGSAISSIYLGIGLRNYLAYRFMYLLGLGLAFFLPAVFLLSNLYSLRLVLIATTLSDVVLIVSIGSLISILVQRVEVVVLGSIAAVFAVEDLLLIPLAKLKGLGVIPIAVLSNTILYYVEHCSRLDPTPARLLLVVAVLVSALILISFYIISLKIAERVVYKWRS